MYRILVLLSLFLTGGYTYAQVEEKASDDAYEDKTFVAMDQTTTGNVSFGYRVPFGELANFLNPYPELGARVGTTLNGGFEIGLGVGLGFKADGDSAFRYHNDWVDSLVSVQMKRANGFRPYVSKTIYANDDFRVMGTLALGFELHQVGDIGQQDVYSSRWMDLNIYTINPELSFSKSIADHAWLGLSASALFGNYGFHRQLPNSLGWGSYHVAMTLEFR